MVRVGRAAVALVALAASSSGLLLPTAAGQEKPLISAQAAHIFATQVEVQNLRSKLSSVVAGFDAMLKSKAETSPPPAGSADAKSGAEVNAFVAKMRAVLAERIHDPTLAMEKLEAVKAEVPKYMAIALGKAAPADSHKAAPSTESDVEKPSPPTRADVEALRSSFANATSAFQVTQADVDNLRAKLEKVSLGLQGLLGSKLTSLAKAHVEPEVKAFDGELKRVLAETACRTGIGCMPAADALRRLQAVQSLVRGVAADLTSREEGLVKEAEAQKESLLLGVLMTLQHEPMDQQLSVLGGADFAGLAVCDALLKTHANNVPLFQQAADFLDHQVSKAALQAIVGNATAHHQRVLQAQADIAMFEGRLSLMARDLDDRTKAHERRSEQLAGAVTRASGSARPIMEKIAQREDDGFTKFNSSQHHDMKMVQEAVAALKQDNVEAATKAVGKLEAPMKDLHDELEALESAEKADFVVLGQLRRSPA